MPRVRERALSERKTVVSQTTLSVTQKLFAMALLADPTFNLTRAAEKAGYAQPAVSGHDQLNNPVVARFIGQEIARRAQRLQITAERVLEELACIAYRDPVEFCEKETGRIQIDDIRKIPEVARRCIDGIKVKQTTRTDPETGDLVVTQEVELKLCSKTGALELLMKHLGMMVEKKEIQLLHQFDWSQLYRDGRDDNGEPLQLGDVPKPSADNTKVLTLDGGVKMLDTSGPTTDYFPNSAERGARAIEMVENIEKTRVK